MNDRAARSRPARCRGQCGLCFRRWSRRGRNGERCGNFRRRRGPCSGCGNRSRSGRGSAADRLGGRGCRSCRLSLCRHRCRLRNPCRRPTGHHAGPRTHKLSLVRQHGRPRLDGIPTEEGNRPSRGMTRPCGDRGGPGRGGSGNRRVIRQGNGRHGDQKQIDTGRSDP